MRFAWLVVLAGCGRVGFDPRVSDGSLGDSDDSSMTTTNDARPPSTCPQSTLICESFDGGLGSMFTPQLVGGGTVLPTTTRPFRGTQSLETTTAAAGANTDPKAEARTNQNIMGAITGTLYARVWIYMPSPFPGSFNQFLTFADTGGTGIGMGVRFTGNLLSNDFTDGTLLESATPMPLDQWFCIVFEIPSNTTGMTRVYLDDVELTDIAQPNAAPQTPPDHIYVGLDWQNNLMLPSYTAWFDELIVDTSPITCAQ